MKSEVITLNELESGDFSVRIIYNFSGFLLFPYPVSFPEPEDYELKKFRRFWNQKEIPVQKKIAPQNFQFSLLGSQYHALHESVLPKTYYYSSILMDEYEFTPPLIEFSSKTEIPKGKYIEYILQTGSGWTGNIEKIETHIFLQKPVCTTLKILPQSYFGACKDEYHWYSLKENCNPKKNIRLLLPTP